MIGVQISYWVGVVGGNWVQGRLYVTISYILKDLDLDLDHLKVIYYERRTQTEREEVLWKAEMTAEIFRIA